MWYTPNILGANVLDFGAIGDGVSDDTGAIITARDYAKANNYHLIFPHGANGIYRISSAIDMADVYFYGQSNDAGVINKGIKIQADPGVLGVFTNIGMGLCSNITFCYSGKQEFNYKSNSSLVHSELFYDVRYFGAIGDGNNHPLSDFFYTLAEAESFFTHAADLSDEIDSCAYMEAVEATNAQGINTIKLLGHHKWNKTINNYKNSVNMQGYGTIGTRIDFEKEGTILFDLPQNIRYCSWKNLMIVGSRPTSTLTTDLTGINNDLTFTSKSINKFISIQYTDPGEPTGSCSITVTGDGRGLLTPYVINVTLANGGGEITATAAQVKVAVEADSAAAALVTIVVAGGNDGTGIVTTMGATPLIILWAQNYGILMKMKPE